MRRDDGAGEGDDGHDNQSFESDKADEEGMTCEGSDHGSSGEDGAEFGEAGDEEKNGGDEFDDSSAEAGCGFEVGASKSFGGELGKESD